MAITPDEKDWTWVLSTPCPDCNYDASAIDVHDMKEIIDDIATKWQAALLQENVTVRSHEDKWSTLEYACHVRDVLRLATFRTRLMLDHDGATFENWDQDETAIVERYDLQDPIVVSGEIATAADELVAAYGDVEGDTWQHRGLRSNGSAFTIETFALYLTHDPIHHLWDVGALGEGQ
jgi:hypothetical protein